MISLVFGENTFLVQRTVKQLEADFSGEVERIEGSDLTLEKLPDIFMGATLFASERMIIIRSLSDNSAVWTELEVWLDRVPEQTHIVLVEAKPDKRTRTYKWLQKHATVIEQKAMQEREVVSWVMNEARSLGFDLSLPNTKALIRWVGTEQWELWNALKKLALVVGTISEESIKLYIAPTPHATSFELLDAIIGRQHAKAEELLADVMQTEDPYRFMGLLSSQLYNLAACVHAGGRSAQQIASDLGVHPYPIQRMVQVAHRISPRDIERLVKCVNDADYDIKTKSIEPWTAIRVAIGQMTQANS